MFAVPSVPLMIETPGAVPDPLDETPVTGEPETVTVRGAVIPEGSSSDNREVMTRTQIETFYRVFVEGSCPYLMPTSKVHWSGLTLDVRGKPEFWPDAVGGISHTEALAALVTG